MKKKLLACSLSLTMALTMALSLTACIGSGGGSVQSTAPSPSATALAESNASSPSAAALAESNAPSPSAAALAESNAPSPSATAPVAPTDQTPEDSNIAESGGGGSAQSNAPSPSVAAPAESNAPSPSAAASVAPTDQTSKDSSIVENGASTEVPGHRNTSTPEFFDDIGKTLSELKNEHPEGKFTVSLDGFPDSAAACFGEQGAKYVYFFFGGQSGDFEKAMNECEEQIKCSGFITTANILFTDMEDDMSVQDFFSLIGVDDYEYLGEDTTAEGWLRFMYSGMEVMLDTNEAVAGGDITGAERVKSNARVSIVDLKILNTNQDLADAVMFD